MLFVVPSFFGAFIERLLLKYAYSFYRTKKLKKHLKTKYILCSTYHVVFVVMARDENFLIGRGERELLVNTRRVTLSISNVQVGGRRVNHGALLIT